MTPRANTETQIRALVWEELRVGGAIAAVCAVVGLLLLAANWFQLGVDAWRADQFLVQFAAFGAPLIAGLLLILSPDNSGHLIGGYSRRILRLPVKTRLAVGVTLVARTLFVAAVSIVLVGLTSILWPDAPGPAAAGFIVLIYLAAQLFDWLRGVVSGLTSAAAIYAALLIAASQIPGGIRPVEALLDAVTVLIGMAKTSPLTMAASSALAIAALYGLSLLAVHAQRVGRRVGIPEIWEWPQRIKVSRSFTAKPFQSPMGAQIWFEVRRSKFVLPITMLGGSLAIGVANWLMQDRYGLSDHGPSRSDQAIRVAMLWGPPISLLAGAALHGLFTRVVGFRRRGGTSGYEYLQPMTSSALAQARMWAGAIMLVPALFAASIPYFWAGTRPVFVEAVTDGLRAGITSPREVVWIFLSRTLLIGLIAWTLMMIGTRFFRRVLTSGLLLVLTAALYAAIFNRNLEYDTGIISHKDAVTMTVCVALIIITLASASNALRRNSISVPLLAIWSVIWALTAWLIRYPMATIGPEPIPMHHLVESVIIALGVATPVPVMFLATLLDIQRRRAIGRGRPTSAPHEAANRKSPGHLAAFAGVAFFVLWLGWPSMPAYVEFRRSQGYPVTLRELNDWYVEPPAGQNAALDYLKASEALEGLDRSYSEEFNKLREVLFPVARHKGTKRIVIDSKTRDAWNYVYILAHAMPDDRQPFDPRTWKATETYWNRVTSKITPRLNEIAGENPSSSRYPIDLKQGPGVELKQLAQLRTLARQSAVDALHWTIARQPSKAADSIIAGIGVSKSLTNEPLLISQLVRIAILGINTNAIETMFNRSVPAEADLARLQRALETAVPPASEGLFLDRAIVGESTMAASAIAFSVNPATGQPQSSVETLVASLVYSPAATRLGFTLAVERARTNASLTYPEYVRAGDRADEFYSALMFYSPLVSILMPGISRAYEAEWRARMYLETARTAIAVERYRLANNKLPAALQDLVPQFLPAVPEDYFAGAGQPLRYRVFDDGSYVVYSVSRNMTDDGGLHVKKGNDWMNGDLRFTVAPMAFRTGPQIAPN